MYTQVNHFEDGTKLICSQCKTGFIDIIFGIQNTLDYYEIFSYKDNISYLLTTN